MGGHQAGVSLGPRPCRTRPLTGSPHPPLPSYPAHPPGRAGGRQSLRPDSDGPTARAPIGGAPTRIESGRGPGPRRAGHGAALRVGGGGAWGGAGQEPSEWRHGRRRARPAHPSPRPCPTPCPPTPLARSQTRSVLGCESPFIQVVYTADVRMRSLLSPSCFAIYQRNFLAIHFVPQIETGGKPYL